MFEDSLINDRQSLSGKTFPRSIRLWRSHYFSIIILFILYSRYYLTIDGSTRHCQSALASDALPPSRTWRVTHLTLCQNVRTRKGTRSLPSQRSADLLALQVKQKPSRCLNPSEGAVWASVLIWPPFGKWRIYFLRQAAITAAVALVWAGGVLEEFWVWLDQWQAYLLEPMRWFMHSGKHMLSPISSAGGDRQRSEWLLRR